MAIQNKNNKSTLDSMLEENARTWHFFNAVRHIECNYFEKRKKDLVEEERQQDGFRPIGLGNTRDPADDPVRFTQIPTLAFTPTSIESYLRDDSGKTPRMNVNFLGLLGAEGPMPRYLTEYAHHRQLHRKDRTLARFLDMFNHRLVSLFYRAWACHQQTVDYDRKNSHRWQNFFSSLSGVQMESGDGLDIPKLYFTGRLMQHNKSSEGLMAIFREYFKVPVTIKEFCGFWLTIPEEYQFKLGASKSQGQLGNSIICGRRIWDTHQKFRVIIGPVNLPNFRRFLRGSKSLDALKSWVRNYVGSTLKWDLQVILKAKSIPKTCLGKNSQLGLTTWLRSKSATEDSYDLIFDPELT